VLLADNRLLLEPGFVTDEPGDPSGEGEDALMAEVVGEDGGTLLHHPLATARFVGDGEAMAEQAVLGKIPLPEGARIIRFLRDGILVHELVLPQAEPGVRLEWDPGDGPSGRQTVKWSAKDPEGLPLRFLPAYSNDGGQTWRPLGLPTTETSLEVDFDTLPGGNGRIAVLATNGGRSARADSAAFRLPKRPCLATILSPEDGAMVPSGREVWLQGQGYYLEEGRPELEQLAWESSIDGDLGAGPLVAARLSDGTHDITLHAGPPKRRGSTAIRMVVQPQSRRR
jgi:hypothetical protein